MYVLRKTFLKPLMPLDSVLPFFFLFHSRNGLIPIKSRYMYAFNKVDKHRCMYIKPSKKGWRKICAKGDQSCEGTSDCSMLQCKT